MDRRRFLLAAAAAPFALTFSAEAALKLPTRVPPPQVRPLGAWKILDAKPSVEVGTAPVIATVMLTFRSEIDVAQPFINVWPSIIPVPPLPRPVVPLPGQPISTPVPLGPPHRPVERPFGEELFAGVLVLVPVQVQVAANTCSSSFRVTVQMSDGETGVRTPGPTRRRAVFSFMLKVVGTNCYTTRVPDPELPNTGRVVNVRPTSRPAATKTPRMPPFRTATPTP